MIVLIIPVVALALALLWVRWSRQPAKPLDDAAQVAAHQRTLAALAPRPGTGPRRDDAGPRMPSLR